MANYLRTQYSVVYLDMNKLDIVRIEDFDLWYNLVTKTSYATYPTLRSPCKLLIKYDNEYYLLPFKLMKIGKLVICESFGKNVDGGPIPLEVTCQKGIKGFWRSFLNEIKHTCHIVPLTLRPWIKPHTYIMEIAKGKYPFAYLFPRILKLQDFNTIWKNMSKKAKTIIILLLIIAISTSTIIYLKIKAKPLKYKLSVGEKFTYETRVKTSAFLTSTEVTSTSTIEVLDFKDGVYTLKMTYSVRDPIWGKKENTVTIKMDERGQIIETDVPIEFASWTSNLTGGLFLTLPEKPLRKGFEWTKNIDLNISLMQLQMHIKGTVKFRVEGTVEVETPLGKFKAYNISFEIKDLTAEASFMGEIIRLKGFEKGYYLLHYDYGWPIKQYSTGSLSGNLLGLELETKLEISTQLVEHKKA